MNIDQFNDLREGDKIENPMTKSSGEVVAASTDRGTKTVRVRWGNGTPGNDVTFPFTSNMLAWLHWEYAPLDCPINGPCVRDECRRGGCSEIPKAESAA